jgi:hypothetical protein
VSFLIWSSIFQAVGDSCFKPKLEGSLCEQEPLAEGRAVHIGFDCSRRG